jgi:hypothetical protein
VSLGAQNNTRKMSVWELKILKKGLFELKFMKNGLWELKIMKNESLGAENNEK